MSDVAYDPLRYAQAGFDYQQGLSDNVTRRRAGAALGAGDYSAAASALGSGGLIPEAVQVGNAARAQATSKREIDEAEHAEQVKFTLQAAEALARVPAERRQQVYMQTVRPVMAQFGFDEAELAQLDAADKGDDSLAALRSSLGGTVPLVTANDRAGPDGAVLRPNAQGGYDTVFTAPVDPMKGLPTGYQRRADGTGIELIPGYAEGSASIASGRRAPPRARSGGSGGGSSGGSPRPRSGGAPSSRPWERSW